MFADIPAPDGTALKVSNSPLKSSRTPVSVDAGADTAAAHTADILRQELGLSDADLARLIESKAIATAESLAAAPTEAERAPSPLLTRPEPPRPTRCIQRDELLVVASRFRGRSVQRRRSALAASSVQQRR